MEPAKDLPKLPFLKLDEVVRVTPPTPPLTPPLTPLESNFKLELEPSNLNEASSDWTNYNAIKGQGQGQGPGPSLGSSSSSDELKFITDSLREFATITIGTPTKTANLCSISRDSCRLDSTDCEFDVIHSPSLPKDFVFPDANYVNSKADRKNSPTVLDDSNLKQSNAEVYYTPIRPRRGLTDPVQHFDTFLDLDNSEDLAHPHEWEGGSDSDYPSDKADKSDSSNSSDATITPVSVAIRSASRAFEEKTTIQSKNSNGIQNPLNAIQLSDPFTSFSTAGFSQSPPALVDESSGNKTLSSGAFGSKNMAPSHIEKNDAIDIRDGTSVGPHLGTIKVGHQYISESHIRRMLTEKRLDAAREANYRLQGVQVIESTREALLL